MAKKGVLWNDFGRMWTIFVGILDNFCGYCGQKLITYGLWPRSTLAEFGHPKILPPFLTPDSESGPLNSWKYAIKKKDLATIPQITLNE